MDFSSKQTLAVIVVIAAAAIIILSAITISNQNAEKAQSSTNDLWNTTDSLLDGVDGSAGSGN